MAQSNHGTAELVEEERAAVVTIIDVDTFGTDWMTWNAAGDRDGWTAPGDKWAASLKKKPSS